MRVQRNALHAISEQQRLMGEKNVEYLHVISEPLRVELHFEMYSPVVEVHPFFLEYTCQCQVVMQKVCHEAMSTLLVSREDIIFSNGEISDKPQMYIICNGEFDYNSIFEQKATLYVEQWLAESALWIHYWMHRGTLKGKMDGRLCVVAAKRFGEIVRQFEQPERFNPRKYAEEFVSELNAMQKNGDEITDLPLDGLEERLKDNLLQDPAMTGQTSGTRKDRQSFSFANLPHIFGGHKQTMMDTPSNQQKLERKRKNSVFMSAKTQDLSVIENAEKAAAAYGGTTTSRKSNVFMTPRPSSP
jgi:hypothetical protein